MTQQELYDYLKNKREWLTVAEISKALKSNPSLVRKGLKQMLKYNEMKCKKIKIHLEGQYQGDLRNIVHWRYK